MATTTGGQRDVDLTSPDQEARPVPAGRYRLLKEIARGSSSVVYRGQDVQLGRDIAVKVFHLSPSDAEQFARQQAELTTLASLNHPSIVTLFDSGTDFSEPERPRAFLVMEHVAGTDLRQLMDVAPLPAQRVAEIAVDILEAMEYMHSHGVIHRDVKPANILIVEDGNQGGRMRVKLSDFGTAWAPGGAIGGDFSSGTAAYMSPEQAIGKSVSRASDVYSLGLVLLECFTGVLAFPGSSQADILARLDTPPSIPAGLPPEWRDLLTAMTAQDPEERPTVESLIESLSGAPSPGTGRHRGGEQGDGEEVPSLGDS